MHSTSTTLNPQTRTASVEFYRDELKRKLSAQINEVCRIVSDENALHRTDVNSTLEDIIAKVINIQKGLNLINLNAGSLQAAGIDIGDRKRRISYQVTSESTASKIHDCLNKFEKRKWYKEFDSLIIFFANDYKPDMTRVKLKVAYSFDVAKVLSFLNKSSMKASIEEDCDTKTLEEIVEYLELELRPYVDNPIRSLPIINDIIKTCVDRLEQEKLTSDPDSTTLLHSREKIALNFKNANDADQVARYLRNSLAYSDLIGEVVNDYPGLDPADLEDYIRDMYNKLKLNDKRPMYILQSLFDLFVPSDKREDLMYLSWSRRIVMKYFENCTIFERTESERQTQGV